MNKPTRFPFKRLKKFITDLDNSFDSLNYGGCGCLAVILAEQLSKITETSIVSNYGDITAAREKIPPNSSMRMWNRHGVENGHVWVEFKWRGRWYAMDNLKLSKRTAFRWSRSKGRFTLQEMRDLCRFDEPERSYIPGWNSTFDRRQIPGIQTFVAREFEQIFA